MRDPAGESGAPPGTKGHGPEEHREPLRALRLRVLTPLYDLLVPFIRERAFKDALLDGARLEAAGRVLDLGAGTGTLTLRAKARAPQAEVVGLDADPEILAIARRKARARDADVEFREGWASDLPFPSGSFDRVLSSLLLHHLTDEAKARTLAETLRVLRPGGELHVADWGAPAGPIMRALFLPVRVLDGFANTEANAKGRIPELVADAGLDSVETGPAFRTLLGTVTIVRARKAGSRGEADPEAEP